MSQTLRFGPSGPPASISAAGDLTTLRWVDPATLIDPSDQTGSSSAPFSTIQQAIDSLLAETLTTGGTVICVDGEYGETPVAWASPTSTARFEIVGFGGALTLGPITITGLSFLTLEGVQVLGTITASNSFVEINRCQTADVATANFIVRDSILGTLTATGVEGTFDIIDSRVFSLSAIGATLRDSVVSGPCNLSGLTAYDTTLMSTINATSVDAVGSTFNVDFECLFANVSACNVLGALTVNSTLNAIGTEFAGLLTLNGSGHVRACRPRGGITAADVTIDSSSYQIARAAATVTITAVTFSDFPLTFPIAITVPAVSAGQVGYLDVMLTGTPLEGVFGIDEPVIVNPTADLVAAGIGGALVASRISAPNTVRLTFLGALASGPATITVSRGR